jgi:hypothetical protein
MMIIMHGSRESFRSHAESTKREYCRVLRSAQAGPLAPGERVPGHRHVPTFRRHRLELTARSVELHNYVRKL